MLLYRVRDNFIDMIVAEPVSDDQQPSVWTRKNLFEDFEIPVQERLTNYLLNLITANHHHLTIANFGLPVR